MASIKVEARFKRLSNFGSKVLIARDNDVEGESFRALDSIYKKLQALKLDTYLPVYSNGSTSSITIDDKNNLIKNTKVHNTYEIEFRLGRVEREGKVYINVILDRARLVKRAADADNNCEILDL